jgi:hypothetical protein
MKGFLFLSPAGLSIGFLMLFSLFLWAGCLVLFSDPPESRGNDLRAGSIFSFRRSPGSQIEFADNHQGLTALEEVEIKFSQFSDGHNGNPMWNSLPCTSTMQGLLRSIMISGLTR